MTVLFVRFVASSMGVTHYSVEIGWATVGGSVEAHIIAPSGDWEEWAFAADVVHGLSLDYLIREGRPAAEVAARVLEVLGAPGAVVLSDDPGWEQAWLDRLLAAAGHAGHGIVVGNAAGIYSAEARRLLTLAPSKEDPGYRYVVGRFLEEISRMVGDCQRAETQRRRVRYRAGPDAEGLRWVLEEIRRRVDVRLGQG